MLQGNTKEAQERETTMTKIMNLDVELGAQAGLEALPLECRLGGPGNGRGGKSGVRVLRLVTNSTEGSELLRRLAGDPLTSGIPIVILARQ